MAYQSRADVAEAIRKTAAEVHIEDMEGDAVGGAFIHLRGLRPDAPSAITHAIDAHGVICDQITRDVQDIGQVAPGYSDLAALLYRFLDPHFQYENGSWTKAPDIVGPVVHA